MTIPRSQLRSIHGQRLCSISINLPRSCLVSRFIVLLPANSAQFCVLVLKELQCLHEGPHAGKCLGRRHRAMSSIIIAVRITFHMTYINRMPFNLILELVSVPQQEHFPQISWTDTANTEFQDYSNLLYFRHVCSRL